MELEDPGTTDVDEGGQCLCGRFSTEGGAEDDSLGLQIECDICHIWYHVRCVGLGPMGANAIDKYHCPRCETMCGASLMKLRTNSHRHDCTDPDARTKPTQVGTQDFIEELQRRTFPDALENDIVSEVGGTQLSLPYLNQSGFRNPVFVDDPEGLGLSMPDPDFCIADVPHVLGPNTQIDVIDVHTQDTRLMSLANFCSAFEIPLEDRATNDVYNCLSMEVSESPLGDQIEPPSVARKLCWVNNVWPHHSGGEWDSLRPPQVQKYCILSMKDSFTDFHTDFGGTSVWYHIFKGEKIFYFIQPTPTNLSLYERWQRLSSQTETFLGDMVDRCFRLKVRQGQTILIPTGWIHAVYTPKDSLVFGGNFLHSLNIQLQLRVFEIEDRIRTPKKFRFPSFEAVNWLAAQKLKNDLSDLNSDSTLCPSHLLGGIKALSQTLRAWLQDLESRPCPSSIDPHKLVRDLGKEVRLAERIANKCNPPKPERESKRKKQKKELNEDFIDISHGSALFFLGGRSAQKKKLPAKSKASESTIENYPEPNMLPIEMLPEKPAVEPNKKKPAAKKRGAKKATEDALSAKHIKLKLPTTPLPLSALGPEMGLMVKAPAVVGVTPFDLTDQDSVRQLLVGPRTAIRQLNTALDDALADFDDEKDEGLVIDELPPTKKVGAKSASALKLKLNVAAKATSRQLSRATLEDLKMTKVHQDDDYIYPSLELSDDEMDIGPTVTQAKDDAWSPKVRVKNVAGKSEPRPSRDGAKKVAAVEMGLKNAAERRRKPKVPQKKKTNAAAVKKPSALAAASPPVLLAKLVDDQTAMISAFPKSPYLLSAPAAASKVSPITPAKSISTTPSLSSSQLKKSKKGMLTAKQRIAKTLGLKF